MSRALAARKTLNAAGCNLSMTDLLLYVAARALTENPRIYAAFAEGEMLIYDRVNLGDGGGLAKSSVSERVPPHYGLLETPASPSKGMPT